MPCVCAAGESIPGAMPDGTSRFHRADGSDIYHFMGCSTFSEYTVLAAISLMTAQPFAVAPLAFSPAASAAAIGRCAPCTTTSASSSA